MSVYIGTGVSVGSLVRGGRCVVGARTGGRVRVRVAEGVSET
jgi:hypothetical protein